MERDLTEATEVTYKKIVRGVAENVGLDRVAFDVIEAAAPIIERQVTERIAGRIQEAVDAKCVELNVPSIVTDPHQRDILNAYVHCKQIARDER